MQTRLALKQRTNLTQQQHKKTYKQLKLITLTDSCEQRNVMHEKDAHRECGSAASRGSPSSSAQAAARSMPSRPCSAASVAASAAGLARSSELCAATSAASVATGMPQAADRATSCAGQGGKRV